MSFRWTLTDPTDDTSYTFEINPNDGGSPAHKKNFKSQGTTAPAGRTLLFEGADDPQQLQFKGTVLSQAQYEAMVLWWSKRYQITLTDDLGRSFPIYITEFTPERKRSRSHPWRHDYTVTALILDVA